MARRHGIKLPHLCYSPKPGYRPDGNCRVCMVEVEGERVLAASCIRKPTPGMKVKTATERAQNARRMVAEMLLADQPALFNQTFHRANGQIIQLFAFVGFQQFALRFDGVRFGNVNGNPQRDFTGDRRFE